MLLLISVHWYSMSRAENAKLQVNISICPENILKLPVKLGPLREGYVQCFYSQVRFWLRFPTRCAESVKIRLLSGICYLVTMFSLPSGFCILSVKLFGSRDYSKIVGLFLPSFYFGCKSQCDFVSGCFKSEWQACYLTRWFFSSLIIKSRVCI